MKKIFTPQFINKFKTDFNRRLKIILEQYNVKDFDEFLAGESSTQLTQKRASFLSPLVDVSLEHTAKSLGLNWVFTAENQYDSKLLHKKLEHKFSLSLSNSWTGHPYSNKTPLHLLIKMTITGTEISGLFICIIDLNKCKHTKWSGNKSGSHSFADLKIHNDDIDKAQVFAGQLVKKQKWAKVVL